MSSRYHHLREVMDYSFNVSTVIPAGLHRTPLEDRRCSVSPFLLTLYPDPEVCPSVPCDNLLPEKVRRCSLRVRRLSKTPDFTSFRVYNRN
ncbi:hypothetical protein XENOCAPTIV_021551 [Xenoophorus captivus]|uniref:Uncharacterized protein n=1 Tax=Xenoophorus captivus TaxID=1517983 RepID=A0ABV0R1H0_9TELE